jgi:membrane-associated phospholipid phosphatase
VQAFTEPSGKLFFTRYILCVFYLLTSSILHAQIIQTSVYRDSVAVYPPGCYQKFEAKKFIIPGILIAYGFLGRHVDAFTDLSESVQKLVWVDNPHNKTTVDNYLQFAPAVAVYALNVAGIKGEHNFVDRSMIYLMSNVIMEGFVTTIKNTSHEWRPSENDHLSYPSGHTAEAFLSATFLYEEYKNVSPWYGIGGYLVAGTVGYLRIYNDAHWLHDVVAGAGFGIASTELSYWLYPLLKRTFFPKSCGKKMVVPVMENHGAGLAFIQSF